MLKKLSIVVCLVLLAGFGYCLLRLFNLRFETGDIYPAYSSLRADPIGAKAYYESLDRLLVAERFYRPIGKLNAGRGTAFMALGVHPHELRVTASEVKELEAFVVSGGRLLIAMFPSVQTSAAQRRPAVPPKVPSTGTKELKYSPLGEHWGFDLGYAALPPTLDKAHKPAFATRKGAGPLPEKLTCHTTICFTNIDDGWRVLYERDATRPVIIERKFGDGTVVLCADSYYFSNEALLKDRQSELLAWFVGGAQRVFFDEYHLGVKETHGVATLARKYQLHGFFASLLFLAALFIWKNSSSLVPPDIGRREEVSAVAGKEAAAGFVNLLRRNIVAGDLLRVCLTEWKGSCARQVSRSRLEKVQAIIDSENHLQSKDQNPIRTYREIARVLAIQTYASKHR